MDEKYDEKYEARIRDLANLRLAHDNFKVFDYRARVVKRRNFPELVERGRSQKESGLVLISGDGDAIVLTDEFERVLYHALKNRFADER